MEICTDAARSFGKVRDEQHTNSSNKHQSRNAVDTTPKQILADATNAATCLEDVTFSASIDRKSPVRRRHSAAVGVEIWHVTSGGWFGNIVRESFTGAWQKISKSFQ
jgi:hypothetical protein